MEFLSIPFSCTLILAFILYYIKENKDWQRFVLLATSVVFVGFYHWQYLVSAIGITILTFYMGKWIHKSLGTKKAPYLLTLGISMLVGIWLYTRYCIDLFPLGISFYTFQAISYLIETYWEEEPEDDIFDFSVYMLLFMKFLSGPIERGYDFLPQVKQARKFDYENIVRGMLTVAWGAFLKLMIADKISPSVDSVMNDVHAATNVQLFVGTLLYPIQLYADFAGYTLMALGFGRMFGFKLSPNFDRPFSSLTTGELWRRWHQSLSFWVRDYVFMTLSASLRRLKEWGVYFSLLVTFVVIGVWHGAGWAFAIYGLIQGLLIMWERFTEKPRAAIQQKVPSALFKTVMVIRTYFFFALSLLFFRIVDVSKVLYVYTHAFNISGANIKELKLGLDDKEWIAFGVAVVIMFLLDHFNAKKDLITSLRTISPIWRWIIYFAIVITIFRFGSFGVENFIYVQF